MEARLKALVSLLIAAACLLALPAAALSAEFTVDSINDEVDAGGLNGVCLSAGVKCTLRAAIEESNSSTGVTDTIKFASNPFNGQGVDTIALTLGSLPLIIDPVHIDGDGAGQCVTEASQAGPCAGVNGPAAGSAFFVEADGVEIDGLAITGAAGTGGSAGIQLTNGATGFVARDNWLGVKLDGSAGANSKGIYLDPNSNGATIGGTAAADRNVFANNGVEGLDIEGADNADVLGNYFGVKPDGATTAANPKDIEITNTVAFEATGNEIGTTVAAGPAPCDGGCNVISGATSMGIDLQGNGAGQNEEPATGPTTVHGNFIGLNAAGTATVANSAYGVYVGKAEDALIGGAENADANFIAGGSEGVATENAEGFEAIGNVIGSGAPSAEITAPGKGVFVLNTSNANPVVVSQNVFDMDGGVGIQVNFGGTEIRNNFIEGAELGVWTKVGPNAAGGNLIEDNVIGESLANGIRIEDKQNEVLGNAVFKSAGAGILLELPVALLFPTENLIGGNAAADENNINESGGPAIKIVDESGNTEEDSLNEVGRNRGAKNTGLFIDLVGAANAGILPPTFATSQQSSSSGSAQPGARIRVFRKKAAEAGELESFLAEALADGSGKWKVTYGSIPVGTLVAATQTSVEGATSELKVATTTADPSSGGSGGSTGGDTKEKDKKAKSKDKDKIAPETTIVKKKIKGRTAKFRFVSSEAGSTFQCKLDKKKFKPCRSPKKYKRLKPGRHVFEVRAIDAAGNKDKTPAKRKFRVLPRR
jgi:Periplasmic copper-binding protein (NosD)